MIWLKYRNVELIALIFVVLIMFAGFLLVSQTTGQAVELAVRMAALLSAIFIGIHLANRFFIKKADPLLLPLSAFLSGLGLIMVWRLKPDLAMAQMVWILIGAFAAITALAAGRRYTRIRNYKYICAVLGIILLFAPVFIGVERGGARLWLDLGPVSFQPAEVAKIFFVFFLAAYLEEKHELLSISTRRVFGLWVPELKHLGPLAVMWLISLIILILERDLGTSLLFFGLFLAMLYVSTGRAMYVTLGTLLFTAGATACYFMFSHVQTRFDIWLNPWVDPAGKGYQIIQSLFAIASGGFAGTGLGLGYPDLIPAIQTDFIFSAIAEELGMLGGVAVIISYLLFASRGFKIAISASDGFSQLVAAGLSCVFALQSFLILGGTSKLIPLTGVTLPYMSYGGSSILMNFLLLALLLIVSTKRGEQAE